MASGWLVAQHGRQLELYADKFDLNSHIFSIKEVINSSSITILQMSPTTVYEVDYADPSSFDRIVQILEAGLDLHART